MPRTRQRLSGEICILAGGLSERMGCDKARLRLGKRTLLGLVLATARATGWPVRVIRRDRVPRCGPLGGVFTALATTRSDRVLFLACDMPFISVELLGLLIEKSLGANDGLFAHSDGQIGFPFILSRGVLPRVTSQLERKEFSLHALARILKAELLVVPQHFASQLRNLNTPDDLRLFCAKIAPRACAPRKD